MTSRRAFLSGSFAASVLLWSGCGGSSSPITASVGNNPLPPTLATETFVDQLAVFNSEGTRFLLDFLQHSVSCIGPNGGVVWSVGDSPVDGLFNFPIALQGDDMGRLFVADRGNGEVDVLDEKNGALLQTIGRGQMTSVRDLTLDPTRQELYACDAPAHNIKVFGFDGELKRTVGSFGQTANGLNFPTGVDFDPVTSELHVCDFGNGRLLVMTPEGNVVRTYGGFGEGLGQLRYPKSVAVLPGSGSLVADAVSGFITEFDASGRAVGRFQPIDQDNTPFTPSYLSLGYGNVLVISGTPAFWGVG